MTPRIRAGLRWAACAVALSLATVLVACGDDGDDGLVPPDFAAQPADLSASTGDGGDGGVSCTDDGGCYSCPPTTNDQFLNHCTTVGCSHFDNARLPYYVPGQPLPPVGQPLPPL